MTEKQADEIIKLLKEIRDGIGSVESSIQMWADTASVVSAIEALRADIAAQD